MMATDRTCLVSKVAGKSSGWFPEHFKHQSRHRVATCDFLSRFTTCLHCLIGFSAAFASRVYRLQVSCRVSKLTNLEASKMLPPGFNILGRLKMCPWPSLVLRKCTPGVQNDHNTRTKINTTDLNILTYLVD